MAEEEIKFSEFVTDKDGDYSKARFMSLAAELLNEGRRPNRVFLAMYRAASSASIQHSIKEHHEFIKTVCTETSEWLPEMEIELKDMIEAQKRDYPID